MTALSKAFANQATAARRTATSLRSLVVQQADLDVADRGVLLTAARIAETIANEAAKRAKTQAREEARYEAAYRAALPAATAAANALPRATTLDRVALIFLGSYSADYLGRRIDERLPTAKLRELLEREVADATREIASSLAHKAARPGKTVADYHDEFVVRLDTCRASANTIRIAARFDAAVAEVAQ